MIRRVIDKGRESWPSKWRLSHGGVLEFGGVTIAVVGTPVEQVHPSENSELQTAVVQTGAVVSQFAPGTPIQRFLFPMGDWGDATSAVGADATVPDCETCPLIVSYVAGPPPPKTCRPKRATSTTTATDGEGPQPAHPVTPSRAPAMFRRRRA